MKKQSILLLLFTILLFAVTSQVSAESTSVYSESLLDNSTQILPVSSTKTLLVDKINRQIQLLEINTGKIVWSKKFPAIYDCEVLMNPTKIVVITEEKNKPLKVTFSVEGTQLSQQIFATINLTENQKLQWSPASPQEKERFALVNEDHILVYQSPWKKPVINISITVPNDKQYESPIVQDVQFKSPYAVVKIYGSGIGQSLDYYKIINLVTKKVNVFALTWNVKSRFVVEGSTLVVNTSSISGSPLGVPTNTLHTIYARYDLKTNQVTSSIKRTFTMFDSNWSSSYFNGYLLITDSEQNQHALFQQNGKLVAQRPATATDLHSRLVGYYNEQAYNIAWTDTKTVELLADKIN
ncbi:hypothetical protein [Paenibacillus macquariensis]|uniref:PQQ-like domain-containing protein n=1 Tax=Paenibacillus macquariensis TaxID=948756 RepID=A0ABY1K8X8_9BACL|nr:hypothetical protein [Paenibacillus macquariensis]MEC0093911.1 hypothetical protein [Paenibacillus macquariensis]OAB26631.1 hypothetical protein PMSM_26045 [Paenibacillus macquariensis subsp. macquariensis]SIR43637.1 hypothetical protein SAMN05421578_1143 [Paenibacillus macquariensis]